MAVTALDAYDNIVTAGNPTFLLDCANCSSLLRTAPTVLSPGTTRFTFSYTAATMSTPNTHLLLLNGTSEALRTDNVTVRAANATAASSRLSGQSQWRAGESVMFEFEPFDVFGNPAVFAENSTVGMDLRAVMRQATVAGVGVGAEVALPVALRSDGLVYEISAPVRLVNQTGDYYVVVQMHSHDEDLQLRGDTELRLRVRVIYERLDMAQCVLEVRCGMLQTSCLAMSNFTCLVLIKLR